MTRNRNRIRTPWTRIAARARSDEAGFTLIELLVATLIFMFVLAGSLSVFETTIAIAPRDQERAHAVREAQVGLGGMVRELRGAYDIVELTPNVMDVLVASGGTNKHVRYECGAADSDAAYRTCTRAEGALGDPPPALGTSKKVLGRLLNATSANPVFSYVMPPPDPPNPEDDPLEPPDPKWPTYIKARVEVPSKGEKTKGYEHKVVFDDGFYLRNIDVRAAVGDAE